MGVLAYYPIAKNRKSRFGHALAQNRAYISTVLPLPDDLYIKDILCLEEQGFFLFVEFPKYPIVTADDEIYVWAGKYDCRRLYAGVQETIKVRHNGHFGVARNRFVFQNTFVPLYLHIVQLFGAMASYK